MSDVELFIDAPAELPGPQTLPACVISHELLFPCRVTDCTDAGATLLFDRAMFIGDEFSLSINDHALDVDCRVAWRDGTVMGIRFKDRVAIDGLGF